MKRNCILRLTSLLLLLLSFVFCTVRSYATAWTTISAGPVTTLANWTNGSGAPATFATPGDTWTITLVMTLPSSGTWTVGTASAAPVTVTLAAGGALNVTGAGGTANVTIHGNMAISGGSFSLGGAGTTENLTVNGNFAMSAGTLVKNGATATLNMNVNGNCTITGGAANLAGASGATNMNVHGNFNMSAGSINTGGAGNQTIVYVYGNYSMNGPSFMTNSGAGTSSTVHLALPTASGTMLVNNTSTGTWSATNIFVDAGCTALLNDNFSTTTGAAAFGLTVDGTLICPATYFVNGTRRFTLSNLATLVVAHAGGINAAITTTGTRSFSTSANYTFNGVVPQVTGTYLPTALVTPSVLQISNAAGVTLSQTTATTGVLAFTSGILTTTPAFTMSTPGVPTAVTGAGATSYVFGMLIKTISGLSSINYEVGDFNYAPMNLVFNSPGTGGRVGVKSTYGLHPNIATSGISSTNIANHYWTVASFAAAGPVIITPTATYNAVDILGGTNVLFITQTYSGGAWLPVPLATTNTSLPYTSAPTAGVSIAALPGDYIFGDAACSALPITGTTTLCAGTTTTLSNATPGGGTWSSLTTTIATVTPGPSAGANLTGIANGTSVIIFTSASLGCSVSTLATVTGAPGAISGATSLCSGSVITLSDAIGGGTWSSSNTGVATVTPGPSSTTTLTGLGSVPGTSVITYSNICGSSTITVTVNTQPGAISGTTTVCSGLTTTLSNPIAGGTWTSSNSTVATVTPAGGVVTGGSIPGTSVITYSNGCGSAAITTVTTTVPPGAITGVASICSGATTTLSAAADGTWSSSVTLVATVGSSSGVVTGGIGGTTIITYSNGCGTASVKTVTVIALPGTITGTTSGCAGAIMTLSNAVTGGTWTSSNSTVATVTPGPGAGGGVVTAGNITSGTSIITYANSCGTATTTITVTGPPDPVITGNTGMCEGASVTLSNSVSGGTWSSATTWIAIVTPGPGAGGGIVSGLSGGSSSATSVISYSNGCGTTTITVTVTAIPVPIVGTLSVCSGLSTTLSNAITGGTWTSSNSSVATVGSASGSVTGGTTPGTTTITYSNGCGSPTSTFTVTAAPSLISGALAICLGGATTLSSNATPPGTWSSSNSSVAIIDPLSGIVASTGAIGSTTITATNSCGSTSAVLSVVTPLPIAGMTTFCQNATTQLSNSVAGGTWTSSNTNIATVDLNTGLVWGNPLGGTGTSNITYTVTGGCFTATTVTTTIAPDAITGVFGICAGATTCLTNNVGGGVWSSSNTTVATINTTSGCVTGLTAGITTISYLVGTCPATATVTVYPLPAPITGPSSVCVGSNITLGNTTTPGQWTSGNTNSATIDPVTGVVTGIAPPGANITYTTAFGCVGTKSITVNALPGPVTGNTTICAGSSTTLSSGIGGGGTWASSVSSVATVSPGTASATVQVNAGVAASGTTSVVVTNAAGCQAGTLVTFNPLPSPIIGPSALCTGTTATLTATPAGGTWNSSAPIVASIDANGVVTPGLPGTTVITYSLTTTCSSTMTVTVNQMPPAITGNPQVCLGFTTALTNTLAGGTWSPVAGTNVNVSGTGIVTGHTVGTENVSYTRAGCSAVVTATVNPLPLAIIGPTVVCVGSTISLTNLSSGGGTWSSSAPATANVGMTTGVVTGVLPGTAVITFTQGTGCTSSLSVTVYPVPATISGPTQLCAGQSATLSTNMSGTWTSSNTTVATVTTGPGATTTITAGGNPGGVVTLSVTTTAGCTTVHTMTINPIPAPIFGVPLICLNGTATLSNVTPGGTWSSSNSTVATVLPSVPIVYGSSVGQTLIIYRLATGCSSSLSVTVNPLPTVIGGNPNVCIGSTTQLSNGTPGGSWSSSTSSVATVNNTGTVFGSSVGQTTITYMLGSGCIQTITVTVNPIPDPITGTFAICNGTCTTLSDATPSGGWTTSNTSIATISASGTMCGVGAGSARVTYTLSPTGCFVTQTITIQPLPAAISGPGSVCEGATINLSTTTTGGAWSTSNSLVATVTTIGTTVVVTGGTAGVADISYTLGTGCAAVKTVTVNVQPGPIVGAPVAICQSSCVQLSNSVAGGVWTSSASSIATVDATGQVCAGGTTTGNVNISYTLGSCRSTGIVTVKPQPGAIVGNKTICQGACSTLSSTVALGAWSSSDLSIATVNAATGQVCGSTINTGTVTITYNLNGCSAMTTVTITPQPGPIQGPNSVCNSNCITLSNQVGGGAWSSNSTIVSVNASTGVVCGTGVGNATITYTIGTCTALKVITVNVQPSAIFGPTQVCNGSSIQLSISSGVGIWSSSNSNVATVNNTGLVTGLDVGTSVITARIGLCSSSTTITVNPLPSQITGIFFVCQNSQTTLQDLTPGGTWSSSNTTVATANPTAGIVYGVTVGLTNITYTLPLTGCIATHTLQVIAAPQPIQGPPSVCLGGCVQMSDVTNGGTWTSSNPGVASINPSTGVACGTGSSGTVVISYTLGSGCRAVTPLTVYPLTPVSGPTTVCEGLTINLSNATVGGAWTTSNSAVATVTPTTGVVTGTGGGTAVIAYTLVSGCAATTTITVAPAPAVITGPNTVCQGQTIALTSATASGLWTSSDASIADVDPFGIVTGVNAGVAYISYTAGGCPRTFSVTVNAAAAPITGNTNICAGNTSDLDDATTGGVWTSSNTTVATVDPVTGMVYAILPGTTTITYAPASGCAASVIVTVNSLPSIIVGPTAVCVGSTIALTDSVAGGAWFSSNYSVADMGFANGIVTGMAPGTAVITYQIFNGCTMSTTITVNALPTISGPTQVCAGSTVTLSGSPAGGTWSTSPSPNVIVNTTTGAVTGVLQGTANITYTNGTTGCASVITMTVNPLPTAITGNLRICKGGTSLLASTPAGGVWTSSNTFVGTVNPSTGLVQSDANPPVSVFNIIYTLPTGCATQVTMTVVNVPSPISGPNQVCVGSCIPLSDTAAGGAWSSFDPTVATVDPVTGQVCGASAGFTIITYTMGGGSCYQTYVVIVNPLPAPITGNTEVCAGLTTQLSDATPGGTWSSQNPIIASVTPTGGLVTGGATPGGLTIISYTLPTTCYVTTTFVTHPLPAPITGNTNICVGNTVSLSSSPAPGTWSSANTLIATVPNPNLGVIYGFDYNVPVGTPYAVTNITYTIAATGCIRTTTVAVHPLPAVFTVTGGGSFCSGTGGVHVGLNGSQIGVSYYLYLGSSTPTGPIAGTGGPLDFGLQTVGGVYTVIANNTYTTCSSNMTGSATITVIPSVAPTVTIVPSPNDTVCAGTGVTFVPMATNQGTAPVYNWSVNGLLISVGASYTFVPADGDQVTVVLNSNAICAIPNLARDTVDMTVYTSGRPSVGILTAPKDTVCSGTTVTFTAIPTNGGPAPIYWWIVNGSVVGSGSTYTYTPFNGDLVQVGMLSNSPCRTADTALSGVEQMVIVNPSIPVVTILGGGIISAGGSDTLTASVSGGIAPITYQWYVNGMPVTGATGPDFVIDKTHYGDSIGCLIVNGGPCHEQSFGWTYLQVHQVGVQGVSGAGADLTVIPNPTSGAFWIKGSLGTTHDQDVTVELTDVLGQVVYRGSMSAKNGKLNNRVEVSNNLANGMYMLSVRTESMSKVFHLVVKQ